MKKNLFLLLFFSSFNALLAQVPCNIGPTSLTSQTAVDNFVTANSACTSLIISGDLIIGPSNGMDAIEDISGLENITAVNGLLDIFQNASLTNLDGLQNITEVGGNLLLRSNTMLTNIDALQNITVVSGGTLRIFNNGMLNEFCGVNTLLNQPNNGGATSVTISSNASNPTAMEIRNGSPCARVLPEPEPEPEPQNLPAIPLPFLAMLGLVILSIGLGSLKLR